jgi:hypothetical protein
MRCDRAEVNFMRNLSKDGLVLLVICGSIVFVTGACAQGVQRKDGAHSNATAQHRREQERLTEKHRQMHAASRGRGIPFLVASPAAPGNLPHQKERLQ